MECSQPQKTEDKCTVVGHGENLNSLLFIIHDAMQLFCPKQKQQI